MIKMMKDVCYSILLTNIIIGSNKYQVQQGNIPYVMLVMTRPGQVV